MDPGWIQGGSGVDPGSFSLVSLLAARGWMVDPGWIRAVFEGAGQLDPEQQRSQRKPANSSAAKLAGRLDPGWIRGC